MGSVPHHSTRERAESPVLRAALEIACEAHEGARSRAETGIEHPRAVAGLLRDHGFDDEVVAAGFLHDVVEDSTTDLDEIDERFGVEVRDAGPAEPIPARKLDHYRETLRILSEMHPGLPFLDELREELDHRRETELIAPSDE